MASFLPTRNFRVARTLLLLGFFSSLTAHRAISQQTSDSSESSDEWAGKPVMTGDQVNGLMNKRLFNAPKVGEQAPNFLLTDAVSGKTMSLLELRKEKPVVLFFASYSCIIAQEGSPEISRLHKRFGNVADFAMIYIQEAHPRNGFLPPERGDPFIIDAPFTFAERSVTALRFAKERHLNFTVLVDTMDDSTAVRWGAWPIRVFIVGRSGVVLYAGQQGPWYFLPSRGFEHSLEGAPTSISSLPGFSRNSLEESLEELEKLAGTP